MQTLKKKIQEFSFLYIDIILEFLIQNKTKQKISSRPHKHKLIRRDHKMMILRKMKINFPDFNDYFGLTDKIY
ncbi:hypothetical protein DERF_003501 [Dermatophagoides farinae]|uniref:Uncharacterized protein n=1 Tax=Dermatophagoides farinae TaxID=6954 RepID=A0A922IDU0_DERFA|nr:hypothetical protein DERF_003501 [Dermatophagoides farinae]